MSSKVNNNNNEGINLKKGYLYVKLALNLGSFVGQYKIWSRKWIRFESKQNDNNFIDLSIFRNQKSENVLFRKSFVSSNTAIFRSRSRSQSYSFTICDKNVAIIHLSTDSETESQLWMQFVRNSLWPPNPLMEFENTIKGHFYASLIDNQTSHRSGLLGAYGYLQLSNANLVLTHPQTGHVIQEWLLSQHILQNPSENVLEVVNKRSSFSGIPYIQNFIIYCEDANQIIDKISRMNRENKVNWVTPSHQLQQLSSKVCDFSSIINKLKEFSETDDRNNDRNKRKSDPIKAKDIDCNTFRVRTLTEIPESMLNSSLSSNNFWSENCDNIYSEPYDPIDYIESDIYEDIDSIYEQIVTKDDNNIDISSEKSYKRIALSSEPIEIKRRYDMKNITEEKQMFGYDMFSQIVKRTHIPLIDTKLSNLRSKPSLKVSNEESVNHYYEMRAIDRHRVDGRYSSDNCEYVYMKSFSI